jgi:hypothetical protein
LVRCSCLLLSAGCCVVAACSGFVHHWYRLQGMSDRVNTQTSMHTYTIACCNSIGQLQLSAGCSEYCRMHRACTGFCNMATHNTGCKACLTASTHANRHAHLYRVPGSRAVAAVCNLFWLLPYAQGLCSAILKRYSLQGPLTDATLQIGAVMSASMLGTCLVLAGVCCWLLVVALLLPAQGLCANQHSQVQPAGYV